MSIDKIIDLMQRGFGALGALLMVVITVVAVVIEGVPSAPVELGVTAVPGVLTLVAFALTVVPIDGKLRGIGYGATGLVAVLGFVATLLVGLSVTLALSLFVGGALVLFAAVFPWLGKLIES